MRKALASGLVLGGFAMAAAALLAGTNLVTAPAIALRTIEDLQKTLRAVVPASLYDNTPSTDTLTVPIAGGRTLTVHRARRDGQITAVAFGLTAQGYGGPIDLLIGLAPDGTILGVRTVRHAETPGLGDRIEAAKSDWITRFAGLSLGNPPAAEWAVEKDGGRFDQFSGATITPRAVIGAIRDGLALFETHRSAILAPTSPTAGETP